MAKADWLQRGREFRAEAREALRRWDLVARPQGDPPYFECEAAPPFDDRTSEYSDTNAWWLCELSRLVYTRDYYEMLMPKTVPDRYEFLEANGIFQIASYNTAGSHFAIFEFERTASGKPATVLCFRGTNNLLQWLFNLSASLDPWTHDQDEGGPEVHQGFKYILEKLWPSAETLLAEERGPFYFTGHSLGGALATMAAVRHRPEALYTFGSPRVGNSDFAALLDDIRCHRLVFRHDIVAQLPVPSGDPPDFVHAGRLHFLNEDGSLLIDPRPEDLPGPAWNPEKPIGSLIDAFETSGAHPPAPMLDHAPIRYTQCLRKRLVS